LKYLTTIFDAPSLSSALSIFIYFEFIKWEIKTEIKLSRYWYSRLRALVNRTVVNLRSIVNWSGATGIFTRRVHALGNKFISELHFWNFHLRARKSSESSACRKNKHRILLWRAQISLETIQVMKMK
jgi:hypothetical protein